MTWNEIEQEQPQVETGNVVSWDTLAEENGESTMWDTATSAIGDAWDYATKPDTESETYKTQRNKIEYNKNIMGQDLKVDAPQEGSTANWGDDYAMSFTQKMVDEGITDRAQIVRRMKEEIGSETDDEGNINSASMVVRRYLDNPTEFAGTGPVSALQRGGALMSAGLRESGGGITTMVGDAAEAIGLEQAGGKLQDIGNKVSASGTAFQETVSPDSKLISGIGAMAPLITAPTKILPTFGAAYGYGRGQGMEKGQAAAAGVMDATILKGVVKLGDMLSSSRISAQDIRNRGIEAFNDDLAGHREQVSHMAKTTGQTEETILNNLAEYLDTVQGATVKQEDAVRMAAEVAEAPRVDPKFAKADQQDNIAGANQMLEAQKRLTTITEQIKNPVLAEIVERNTKQIDNIAVGDWKAIHQELTAAGVPSDGPMMKQIEAYTKLDDIKQVAQRQGAGNPDKLESVGTRTSGEEQGKAELMRRAQNWVMTNIPGEIGRDARLIRSIRKSFRAGRIDPQVLKDDLLMQGVDPEEVARVTKTIGDNSEALEREFANIDVEGVQAGEITTEQALNKIDNSPLGSGELKAEDISQSQKGIEDIFDEFSHMGDELDDLVTEGMEQGLERQALYEHVKKQIGMRAGFASPEVVESIASSGVGATGGALSNEENPLMGAVGGAAVGAVAPTALRSGKMRAGQIGGTIETAYDEAYELFKGVDGVELNELVIAINRAEKEGITGTERLTNWLEGYLDVKRPEEVSDVGAQISEAIEGSGYKANERSVRGMGQMQKEMDQGRIPENTMFYDEASELYKRDTNRAPGTITHPDLMKPETDFRNDPKVLQNVEEYTRDTDEAVHRATRGDDPELLDPLFGYPANYEGTMYRGSRLKGPEQKAEFDALQPGDILGNKAHLSTSTSPGVAREFMSEPKHLVMREKGGMIDEKTRYPLHMTIEGEGHFIEDITAMGGEMEALIQAGNLYEVLDAREIAKINHLLVKQLPGAAVDELRKKGVKINKEILQAVGFVGGASALEQAEASIN